MASHGSHVLFAAAAGPSTSRSLVSFGRACNSVGCPVSINAGIRNQEDGRPRDACRQGRATTRATTSDSPSTEEEEGVKYSGPELKTFAIADGQYGEVLSATVTSLLRLGTGGFVRGYTASIEEGPGGYTMVGNSSRHLEERSKIPTFPRPKELLQFYEFEGCPFCRKVREAVTILDLDALYYPCPKNGPTFRKRAEEIGGKQQFPYLVDPNTGMSMYESSDIIKYLFDEYGDGEVPALVSPSYLTIVHCGLAMAPRVGKGSDYEPSRVPEKPITFWAYESSPFCKVVQETLCALEIPYVKKNCARGSPKRQEFYDKMGAFQVPYIEDPNTGISMFESSEIVKYLRAEYAA